MMHGDHQPLPVPCHWLVAWIYSAIFRGIQFMIMELNLEISMPTEIIFVAITR